MDYFRGDSGCVVRRIIGPCLQRAIERPRDACPPKRFVEPREFR